jgi:serine protease
MGATGDGLSAVQSQYTDSSGHHPAYPTSLGHSFAGWAAYCGTVPASATDAQLAAVAQAYASFLGAANVNRSTQIIVVSPSGTNPGGGFGSSYCAYHNVTTFNSANLSWTNLPYMPDAGANCGANFIPSGPSPALQGWSIVAGHEYAESATDPFVTNTVSDYAWYDNQGFEIGDKCAWTGIYTESTATGSYVQQPEWSNATSACAQSASISDTVYVQRGVNLSSTHGHAVTYQVYGHSFHNYTINYSATGLPAGLSLNTNTGVISGTPTHITTYTAHVKAYDKAYPTHSATATFSWKIA